MPVRFLPVRFGLSGSPLVEGSVEGCATLSPLPMREGRETPKRRLFGRTLKFALDIPAGFPAHAEEDR